MNQQTICEQGHLGPLCESCDNNGDIWEKRYNKINNKYFMFLQLNLKKMKEFLEILWSLFLYGLPQQSATI